MNQSGLFGRVVRLVLINLGVFLATMIVIEGLLGHWRDAFSRLSPSIQYQCEDPALHHNLCPSAVYKAEVEAEAGTEKRTVQHYVNASAIQVASVDEIYDNTDFSKVDVVNIGDSYMLAAAIPFDHTVGYELSHRTGKRVLQVGNASWAPNQYYTWLKNHPMPPGTVINVFPMLNDFDKVYDLTNIRYHQMGKEVGDGMLLFPVPDRPAWKAELKRILGRGSYFFAQYVAFRGRLNKPEAARALDGNGKHAKFALRQDQVSDRCEDFHPGVYAPLTEAYWEFAFSDRCWDKETQASVGSAVSDLRRLVDLAAGRNWTVNFLLVPGGFDVPGENLVGKTGSHLNFQSDAYITSDGLVEHLQREFPTVRIVSLEKVFRDEKTRNPGDNRIYFPVDVHWNMNGHKVVAEFMAENGLY
jgi:hypothetical protein